MSVVKAWTKRLLPTVMVAWITGCTPTEVKVHDGLFDTWVEEHRGLELEIRENGTATVFGYETTWRAPDKVPPSRKDAQPLTTLRKSSLHCLAVS